MLLFEPIADVQELAICAGGQRLRPMMIDRRWQIRDFHGLRTGLCLAILVLKSHDRILVGDEDAAVDQCETIRRIEIVGEYRLHFVDAITVCVAQQGEAVPALHGAGALRLNVVGDEILGFEFWRVAASAFGHEDVPVRQQ